MSLIASVTARSAHPHRGWAGFRLSRWLCNALLVAIVVTCALLALPRLLGYEMLTIHSGSMSEMAPVGSLVVSKPLAADDVRVGDVVRVRVEGEGVATPSVLHRVIELTRRDGEIVVRTKGDSNPKPDPTLYVLSGNTSTPVLVVPYAGRVLVFAQTPLGWMTAIALPATLVLWLQLKSIWFSPRRSVRTRPALGGDDNASI